MKKFLNIRRLDLLFILTMMESAMFAIQEQYDSFEDDERPTMLEICHNDLEAAIRELDNLINE
jgi:hypothetical protein